MTRLYLNTSRIKNNCAPAPWWKPVAVASLKYRVTRKPMWLILDDLLVSHHVHARIGWNITFLAALLAQFRLEEKHCNSCSACLCEDCGACKFCVDKPKYGVSGKKKQCCVKRCCLAMKADIPSPASTKRKAQERKNINFTMLHFHLTLASSFLFSGCITKDDTFSTTAVSLPDFLNQSGHKLHPVKGDRNCMFWCFSHHLLGNEEEHDAVRTLIIQFYYCSVSSWLSQSVGPQASPSERRP